MVWLIAAAIGSGLTSLMSIARALDRIARVAEARERRESLR